MNDSSREDRRKKEQNTVTDKRNSENRAHHVHVTDRAGYVIQKQSNVGPKQCLAQVTHT